MKLRLEQLLRFPQYFIDGVNYHLGGTFFVPKPRMVQFPVCDRCNARCIMCNRWKKDTSSEIDLEQIKELFGNDLFSEVEVINIHGGEPTLRKDLLDICRVIQNSFPKLKQMWISTNGFGSKRIEKRMIGILNSLNLNKIEHFEISVSIDGVEETHDKIRGTKGGFRQSIDTIRILTELAKRYPITISIGTVIQPLNVHQVDEIEKLAQDLGVTIHFQPLMFDKFFNIGNESNLKFSQNESKRLKDIIERKLSRGSDTSSFYWRDFLSMMNGNQRRSPCAFDRYVFSIYPTGEVLPCSREDWTIFGNIHDQRAERIWYSRTAKEIREKMKKEVCPTCSSYCGVQFSLQKEFFTYLRFYIRKKLFGTYLT